MPGAVLHLDGEELDPRPILDGMSLRPYPEFRKGEKLFPNNPRSAKASLEPTPQVSSFRVAKLALSKSAPEFSGSSSTLHK